MKGRTERWAVMWIGFAIGMEMSAIAIVIFTACVLANPGLF
jgi:hypothetical protein